VSKKGALSPNKYIYRHASHTDMGQKQKGTNAERELVHKFWETGSWVAHRIAGSGSSKYPSPDIIASNILRKMAIECKATKSSSVYIPKDEVQALITFSKMFGAEPWVAVRFARKDWLFITTEDLHETESSYAVTEELARMKGLLFEEVVSRQL
jgi:holliday junction resolvase Hjr